MFKWFKKKKADPDPPYSNEQWVLLLSEPVSEKGVAELRRLLIRGLKPALYEFVDWELEQFVEDVAQDATLKILKKIDTFRGESKFMTWAMKIAVREGLTELRRKRWDDISIEQMKSDRDSEKNREVFSKSFEGGELSPESATVQKLAVEKVKRMIEELLTKRQQQAIKALMIDGLPGDIVAEQLGTNRNNLYKILYDARKKLKNELEVEEIDPGELLRELSDK